ncbi:hypothetical protein NDU88_002851 [Pleurodeles waltl]|uniref:Uncharacterized protein n=1 Tax=Pleurodeles waltl TaxID=8319 RepID=A0AAV7LDJ6_PLEWA|nr:hypothetical protein NDU88_002851 [Pleurodeles waltl]
MPQIGARSPNGCQREKRGQFEQARSGAPFNKAGLCEEDSAGPVRAGQPPCGLADGSDAHDGVAASSPYLTAGDGVQVTAPVHPAHSPDQLG